MTRLFLCFAWVPCFTLCLFGAEKEVGGERKAAQTACPTPQEAQAKMTVPEGYEVRCFAHEPMVQNPVAMTWDHRGRLWVVEAYEYPEGSELPAPFGGEANDDRYHPMPTLEKQIPRDRVIILEDTDHDGEADKRTVFVEGLNLASAILCGDNGIYIGQQPHLLHFRDDDGDDRPDAWRVVLTGFGREDTHELVNSFTWGPDGWLYMTHGVFTNSKVRRPGQPESQGFKFDAGIGRARALSRDKEAPWEFEVFADGTSNPWGCDYDAAGHFFVSACVIDHFFHMAPGGLYVRQGGAPENPYSYELLPSIVKHKHFRAAYAGVQIYQGGRYPADTHGHAFIGNIHDNAIHEEVLTPVGATFKCEPRRDFLRANDGWFRPVSTQTGPDGFLWIMDWCDKYPCYQNAKANPEGVDRERGRIWRVVYTSKEPSPATSDSREHATLDLKKLSSADLVKTLEHPNNWMRRMARRLLVEGDTLSEKDLDRLNANWMKPGNGAAAMESFWTLLNMNRHREILHAAESDHPALLSWFGRFLSEGEHSAVSALPKLIHHSSMAVRSSAALALRGWVSDKLTVSTRQGSLGLLNGSVFDLMRASAKDHDEVLAFQIWMVMEPLIAGSSTSDWERFAVVASEAQPLSHGLAQKAMRRLCDTRQAEKLDHALAFCEKIAAHEQLLAQALEGLVKGQEGGVIKPAKHVSTQLAAWRSSASADVRRHAQTLAVLWGDDIAVREMVAAMQDSSKSEKDRIAVLQSLRKVKSAVVKEGLMPLLTAQSATALSVAAIRAAADLGGDEFVTPLLALASAKDFNIRHAAFEALASRAGWTHSMLDAIAAEKVSAVGFPAPVRRALATSQDKSLRDHAFRVLGAWQDSSEDVKSLIAQKKQACLTGEPDLANGKVLFTATCMVCHEFHGGGQKVGPDLIGSGRSNLDALLANVIDPNQIIGNGYENFTLSTQDGRTLAGRVVEDTPSHVKLLGAGGAAQVVPRDQIATLTNTKQSLMPTGFGGLPDAMFRDLIWYVLAPPEEGPLTPEKKKQLIEGVEVPDTRSKPAKTNWRAIDWESISLWNSEWKVSAPDFERTPVKLAEYHGRNNVLLMHPFPDKKTPASLERTWKVAKKKLIFHVAADDRGDWQLKVLVHGQVVKQMTVDHDKPRWKTVEVDLSQHLGQEIVLRLEAHANGWDWEFAYWHDLRLE